LALKVIIPRQLRMHDKATLLLRMALLGFAALTLGILAITGFYYVKYQRIVEDRLKEPIFASTAKIYAAPRQVRPGQKLSVKMIASELSEAGYSADGASQT